MENSIIEFRMEYLIGAAMEPNLVKSNFCNKIVCWIVAPNNYNNCSLFSLIALRHGSCETE